MVWILIRTDVLSVLIWVSTVFKGYQQTTLLWSLKVASRQIYFAFTINERVQIFQRKRIKRNPMSVGWKQFWRLVHWVIRLQHWQSSYKNLRSTAYNISRRWLTWPRRRAREKLIWHQVTNTWRKVSRSIPEFRILRLTFNRKSASNCWISQSIIESQSQNAEIESQSQNADKTKHNRKSVSNCWIRQSIIEIQSRNAELGKV